MGNLVPIKGGKAAPRASRSKMETMLLTIEQVNQWRVPPFQRPIKVNEKVRALAESLRTDGGMIGGVITLGQIGTSPVFYIVDGQHRMESFRISGLPECIADVRLVEYGSMAEMADAFVELNTALVKMGPDDVLRGLEGSLRSLQIVRKACPFVGYDNVRRGSTSAPIVSMSAMLRLWSGSSAETPVPQSMSAAAMAHAMDEIQAETLARFMNIAFSAWGRDPENYRFWGACNLGICMWLYRRLVLDKERGVRRYVVLNQELFKKCLMSLAADKSYADWLPGRLLRDRDRPPAYARIKAMFVKRIAEESGRKVQMPSPAWAKN